MNTDPTAAAVEATAVRLAGVGEYLAMAGAPAHAPAPLTRIAEHWFKIGETQDLPMRSHFRPEELVGVLPDLFIVELVSPGLLRYRLVGTRLAENFSSDPTTQFVGQLEAGWGEMVFKPLSELVLDTGKPHLTMAYAPPEIAAQPVAAAVGMPLFNESGVVNMVLGACTFGSLAIMAEALPDRVVNAELLP